MWDLIVSVPDHCLSFYFGMKTKITKSQHSEPFFFSKTPAAEGGFDHPRRG